MKYVPFLKENDMVDMISPATSCTKDEIKKAKKYLSNIGLRNNMFFEKKMSLARKIHYDLPIFGIEDRFEQLMRAIENDSSQIIWCLKGGYGSGDLLKLLKKVKPIEQKKFFIGFSDITSLTNFFVDNWGWKVFCAPMLVQLAEDKITSAAQRQLVSVLFGEKQRLEYQLVALNQEALNCDLISAPIVGGCFSVLASHFGTSNQIILKDKILFLEDIKESGERLDRYFRQLTEIIIEQKQYPAAILLGNFLRSDPYNISRGGPKAKSMKLALSRFVERFVENHLPIPIFEEITSNLGHSRNMLPLVLGSKSQIRKMEENFSLTITEF
jgi:muramoyltetrapeptide carboxypeptidase